MDQPKSFTIGFALSEGQRDIIPSFSPNVLHKNRVLSISEQNNTSYSLDNKCSDTGPRRDLYARVVQLLDEFQVRLGECHGIETFVGCSPHIIDVNGGRMRANLLEVRF